MKTSSKLTATAVAFVLITVLCSALGQAQDKFVPKPDQVITTTGNIDTLRVMEAIQAGATDLAKAEAETAQALEKAQIQGTIVWEALKAKAVLAAKAAEPQAAAVVQAAHAKAVAEQKAATAAIQTAVTFLQEVTK